MTGLYLSECMQDVKLKLQLRILLNQDIAFGPGKAELLEEIRRTGSISQAAKSMNMSYRRAWQLVEQDWSKLKKVEHMVVGQNSQTWAKVF